MNRTEVITEISQVSGVAPEDCDKVINALEQVLKRKLMSIFKNN